MTLSVTEKLRCAAYICSGSPPGIYITRTLLTKLADQAGSEKDALIDMTSASGFEAVAKAKANGGDAYFFFAETKMVDRNTWHNMYVLGYRDNRFPVPAIRPRRRVRAISIRYAPYALG